MAYQYKREPLTQHEATGLANACITAAERLAVWTLLDTGLRVLSETRAADQPPGTVANKGYRSSRA